MFNIVECMQSEVPLPWSCSAGESLNSTFFLPKQELRGRMKGSGLPRRGLHLQSRYAHGVKTNTGRENPHVGNASPGERTMSDNRLGSSA